MKKSLFPDGGVWLKGNIHSHSTVSDGMFSPRELAELYRDHGYAFLSMTDHNVLVSHSELPEDQIILLTGLEHDLEYSPDKCMWWGLPLPARKRRSTCASGIHPQN